MTTSTESFYDSIEGALTPEQALQALAMEQGDTGEQPENGGAPASTTGTDGSAGKTGTETEQNPGKTGDGKTVDVAATEVDESQIDPTKAVVLAKDGKHTIPYAKLEQARQGEQHWKATAEAAQQQLATLQSQAQERADAGQAATKTDNLAAAAAEAIEAGVDADLFGDFSEKALAAGIQKLVAQQVAAQVDARVSKAVAPLQEKHQVDAATAHYDAIYSKHPNADSIAQSAEFHAWVEAQPSVVRNAYWDLFDGKTGGTASEIVEVFDAYKAATEKAPTQTPPAAGQSAAALASARAVKADPPASLSSIPGGHAQGGSALDATADMSGQEMLAATQGLSPAQLEAWLNKQI